MNKLFILLFIIFIINYFLVGCKELYSDFNNINNQDLCNIELTKFSNNLVINEIKKRC